MDLEGQNNFPLSRAEAFSDSVFAFAITLLVINLRLPETALAIPQLNRYLATLWPEFLTFLLSFWIIYRFWNAHVRIFKNYKELDGALLAINAFLLLCVVILPFATNLISLYPHDRTSVTIYAAVLSAAGFLEAELWQRMKHHPELLHRPVEEDEVNASRNYALTAAIIFACSIPLALFVPYLTELMWLAALLIRRSRAKKRQKMQSQT